MYAVSDQWLATVGLGHRVYNQVQVWDRGAQIGSLPILSGSVTDEWVSGTRRSLRLTCPPTADVKSMIYPGVELVPYSGINYGNGYPEIVPMGVFPVTDSSMSIRAESTISLTCNDRWQWVQLSPFPKPRPSNVGMTIQDQAIRLITETGQWAKSQVTNLVSSAVTVQAQTWEGDRHTAITDLLATIGAEVFIDRSGNPVIRYRQTKAAAVATFAKLDRLKDLTVSISSADVFNAVIATSTSTDPAVPSLTYTAAISDASHPAYPRHGVPTRTFLLNSPQFTTAAQLKNSAQKVLSKVSRYARQLAVEGTTSDASLDASDTITVTWPATGVTETAMIQSVEHSLDLSGSGSQQITTVSSRTDEDFTP